MLPIDPIAAVGSVTQGNLVAGGGLVAGNQEALAGADRFLMHRGNGMKFVFELPKEITAVNPVVNSEIPPAQILFSSSNSTNFGSLAQQMIRETNTYQQVAGEKVRDVLMGGKTTVHEAMIAVQESSVAFSLLAEMRNKLVDAHQELNRMSI